MVKKVERLSATKVAKETAAGLYADGAGLYLRVGRGGAKNWAFRYMLAGKAREMGLGGLTKISLADARKRAGEVRRLLADGIDPIDHKEGEQAKREAAEKLAAARSMTFDECAAAYMRVHEASWRNPKHRKQWASTLATYVSPAFGSLPVQAIDVPLVMKVIEPIWNKKPETGSRVRGRIETVLDWAKVRGFRTGENPARWRGHLDQLLPTVSKVRKVKHHAALPYDELGAFMQDLRARQGTDAAALEFTILTAGRTNQTIGARWCEIDGDKRIWTVPAKRMKGTLDHATDHRVPLSRAAVAVLDRMKGHDAEFLFPGMKAGKPLSNMAMLNLLGRMGRGYITVHGFRSTFKDWAAERTNFPPEVSEMALAHVIDDKVEAAYRRGDLFEKRRRLMDVWAEFASSRPLFSHCAPLKADPDHNSITRDVRSTMEGASLLAWPAADLLHPSAFGKPHGSARNTAQTALAAEGRQCARFRSPACITMGRSHRKASCEILIDIAIRRRTEIF